MDNNINGFGLFQNITPYKSSDFNINTNFSNNNENDFNNYLLEFNNKTIMKMILIIIYWNLIIVIISLTKSKNP